MPGHSPPAEGTARGSTRGLGGAGWASEGQTASGVGGVFLGAGPKRSPSGQDPQLGAPSFQGCSGLQVLPAKQTRSRTGSLESGGGRGSGTHLNDVAQEVGGHDSASQLAGRLSSTRDSHFLHSLLKNCLGSQARRMRGSSPPGCASPISFCTPLAGRPQAPGRAASAPLPSPPVLLTLLMPGPFRDAPGCPPTVLGGPCPWFCSAVAALRTSPVADQGPRISDLHWTPQVPQPALRGGQLSS